MNKFTIGDTVIFNNRRYTILAVDVESKLYKLEPNFYVSFNTIHKTMETNNG